MELPRTPRHAEYVQSPWTLFLGYFMSLWVWSVGLFWYFLSFAIFRLSQLSVTLVAPLPASNMTSPSIEITTLCCCSLGMSQPCTSPHNQSKPMCLRLLSCQWQGASLLGSDHLLGPTPRYMHEGWFHPPSRLKEGHDSITWLILPVIYQALNYCALLCLPLWATLATKGTSDSECFSHEKTGLPV